MSDLSHFELSGSEVDSIMIFSPYDDNSNLPAYYSICMFLVSLVLFRWSFLDMFQRQMKHRLVVAESSPNHALALDAELMFVDAFLKQWTAQWCPPGIDFTRSWIFRHEANTARLLLYLRILKRRRKSPRKEFNQYHQDILHAAEVIFEEALEHHPIPHLSWKTGIVVFAAGIILRLNGRKELVLRVALRMAGDPENPPLNTFTRQNGYQMLAMLL
jgi:hypothetical protein